jgi:hypothetical protein
VSFEEIAYDLEYHGDNPATRVPIVSALARMPEDVRQFALHRCVFISVGGALGGYYLPGSVGVDPLTRRSRNVWLIILDNNNSDVEGTAHELAHIWLGHTVSGPGYEDWAEGEEAAEALARQWGFTGPGVKASSRSIHAQT